MNKLFDCQGQPLSLGEKVAFISGPNCLQVGVITGFKRLSRTCEVVEIVVERDGSSFTLTAAPFVCARLS